MKFLQPSVRIRGLALHHMYSTCRRTVVLESIVDYNTMLEKRNLLRFLFLCKKAHTQRKIRVWAIVIYLGSV